MYRSSRCAAAIAAAVLATASSALAVPELILDLRAADGSKTASVDDVGDVVSLNLYALVLGNGGATGFNATQGAWKSGSGGMLGNLSTSLASGFDLFGSVNPSPADLDSDGDFDIGAAAAATSGHWIASAGTSSNVVSQGSETIGAQTYQRWLIGTGSFTVTDFGSGSTSINYEARTGATLVRPHKYTTGDTFTSILGSDSRLSTGAAVQVSGPTIWTGGAGNWSEAAKWNTGVVPGIAAILHTVLIDNDNAAASSVTLDTNAAVGRLAISSGDALGVASGKSLEVHGIFSNSGALSVAGGGSAQLNAVVNSTSTITNDGTLTIAAGPAGTISTLSGSGTTSVANGRSITSTQVQQGSISVGGSWDVSSDLVVSGSISVAGAGTLNVNGAVGGGAAVSNNGSITLAAGSNASVGAVTGTGTINLGGSRALSAASIAQNALAMSNGSSVSVAGSVTLSSAGGLSIPAGGSFSANGNLALTGGAAAHLVAGGTTNHVGGDITLSGGDLTANATLTAGNVSGGNNVNWLFGNSTIGHLSSSGTVTIASGATLSAGNVSGHGALVVNGATTVGGIDGAGSTTVAAAATLATQHVRQSALAVNGNVTITGSGSDGTSKVASLAIAGATNAWTGTLDLAGNSLIVSGGADPAATLATVTNQIKSGMNLDSGYWDGSGITDSAAAADLSQRTALGVLRNNGSGSPVHASFGGQAAVLDDILVKHTWYGDLNLDGEVDLANDFAMFVDGFNNTLSGWQNGDLNYDGTIDLGNDFAIFVDGYNSQGSPLSPAQVAELQAMLVPEPGALSVLVITGACWLMPRRRRGVAAKAAN